MDDNIRLYLPFAKKDNDKRVVAGYATSEALDSQGEIVKLDAIKKALPDYMKFGNIREMHQWSAVGKAVQATVDESKKALYLVAKVVDENAWQKCKEGVYNGFSIGGRILKKINNEIQELTLNEISLVDRPANPSAVFSLVKMADVQKQMETKPVETDGEPKHVEIFRAGHILQLAAELVYLYGSYTSRNLDAKPITKAIDILKQLIQEELNRSTEAKKVDSNKVDDSKVLNEILKGLDKKEFPYEEIKSLAKVKKVYSKALIQENWATKYYEQLKKVIG